MKIRCHWADEPEIMKDYHDHEWGVPVHDERAHFEFLTLESAQAGLSWLTILKKRDNYRRAFANFEPQIVAGFDEGKIRDLLADPGIVRNKLKVNAAVNNARAFLEIQARFGSFDAYVWDFVDGRPVQNEFTTMEELPPMTPRSEALARDLKKRGFKFLGPTTVYAHMQASGLVNDHLVSCFRYEEVRNMGR